jgi:hypothetical protein
MSAPAKDEAELMEWVGRAIWHHGDGREDAEAAIAGGEAMDDMHGGIFWVRADGGGLVSATPGEACDEIKRLRAENARLRALLDEAADALEEYASDEYLHRDKYPSEMHRYKRAMEFPSSIRAALEVKP